MVTSSLGMIHLAKHKLFTWKKTIFPYCTIILMLFITCVIIISEAPLVRCSSNGAHFVFFVLQAPLVRCSSNGEHFVLFVLQVKNIFLSQKEKKFFSYTVRTFTSLILLGVLFGLSYNISRMAVYVFHSLCYPNLVLKG